MADKTTATVILEAILRDEDARKELLKLQAETERVGKKGKKVGGDSKSWLSKMKAGWIAVAAVVAGTARAVVKFGKEAIGAASAYEEANAKFNTVFRGVTREANAMRDELVRAYAMSSTEATNFLSSIQDMLVPMGFARGAAADMGGEIVKLAADLGSFNNMPTEQVMQGIQSALAGQIEPMRRYGVFLTQARIEQEAMNMGLIKTKSELTQQIKAQATLAIITKDSADATGDMARTYDSWANTMKRVRAFAEDVKVLIGEELMEAFKPAVKAIADFIGKGEGLEKVRKGIMIVIRSVKILGDIFMGLYSISRTIFEGINLVLIQPLRRAFLAIGETLVKVFTGKWGEIGKVWKDNIVKLGDDFVNTFKDRLAVHKDQFQKLTDDITAIAQVGNENRNEDAALSADQRYSMEMEKLREHLGLRKEEEIKFGEEMGEFRRAMAEINDKLNTDASKKFVDLTKQALRDVSKLVRARAKADEERVNQETDATIDALERRRDAGILTEEEFQEGKTAAEKKAAKEIATIKLKAFIAEKRAKIAEIIMATALGIMSAFKIPPPLGAIAAAAVAVLGGVQIAAVNAQEPPTIPAFAAGGIAGLHGPEVALLGERGPEIVIPAAQSAAMMSGDTDNSRSMTFGEKSVVLQVSGGPEGARRLITSLQKLADSSGGGSFF